MRPAWYGVFIAAAFGLFARAQVEIDMKGQQQDQQDSDITPGQVCTGCHALIRETYLRLPKRPEPTTVHYFDLVESMCSDHNNFLVYEYSPPVVARGCTAFKVWWEEEYDKDLFEEVATKYGKLGRRRAEKELCKEVCPQKGMYKSPEQMEADMQDAIAKTGQTNPDAPETLSEAELERLTREGDARAVDPDDEDHPLRQRERLEAQQQGNQLEGKPQGSKRRKKGSKTRRKKGSKKGSKKGKRPAPTFVPQDPSKRNPSSSKAEAQRLAGDAAAPDFLNDL